MNQMKTIDKYTNLKSLGILLKQRKNKKKFMIYIYNINDLFIKVVTGFTSNNNANNEFVRLI